ncbi:c-type cytochrome [Hyalangium minutum]|uniref:Surface antigen protein n=1 Tax=Hyalangium minutum TaxID=394096 RepID=A0A085W031_9BACT|nr:c-type cytochrome [Hyalangium minutum]KFE61044.1 Surface antigen protein [Hyalangium minutum]
MKKRVLAAALVAVLGLTGCEQKPSATYTPHAGTLALSRDDAFLYAVDSDNGIVAVVDTATRSKVAEVKVGLLPERITVGPDDTLYVSNVGSRSVSIIRRDQWTEAARLDVGVEPMGLGLSADGKTLYVVNSAMLESTEQGSLMAFDTGSLKRLWELPVGDEPRGLAILENGKALITLHRKGDVVQVDLSDRDDPKLVKTGTDVYQRANASKFRMGDGRPGVDIGFSGMVSFHPRGMDDLTVMPDGSRAFATARWAREDPVVTPGQPTPPPGGGGGSLYGGGGPCGTGAIASPGVITFDADTSTPVVDDLNGDGGGCGGGGDDDKDFPPSTIVSPDPTHPIQGPIATAVDPTGAWLFVVNRETNNVAVMPTNRRSGKDVEFRFPATTVRQLVRVGAGPNGIALSRDGLKAYVYNAFDHTVTTLVGDGSSSALNIREEGPRIKVAEDVLSPEAAMGRRLFFSAIDSRMTANNVGAACATCHPSGRDDGHVWGFPDGPRQTPTLAGRMITKTGPFHWSGEFPSLRDFLDVTVRQRMGGGVVDAQMASQLAAFLDVMPTPDNPYKRDELTDAQIRGSTAFLKAECNECHTGETLTNNKQANVGTFVTSGSNPDNDVVRQHGLNTPSLLGLARSAPYLHDGSAQTLKERLLQTRSSDTHGKTSRLSNAELDDLVEFLRVL